MGGWSPSQFYGCNCWTYVYIIYIYIYTYICDRQLGHIKAAETSNVKLAFTKISQCPLIIFVTFSVHFASVWMHWNMYGSKSKTLKPILDIFRRNHPEKKTKNYRKPKAGVNPAREHRTSTAGTVIETPMAPTTASHNCSGWLPDPKKRAANHLFLNV